MISKENSQILDVVSSKKKFSFKTDANYEIVIPKGISEDVVRNISHLKNEPQWAQLSRLQAYQIFNQKPMPTWGPCKNYPIDFQDFFYFIKSTKNLENNWDNVPKKIKQTFDKLGIPKAEQKFLAGVGAQFESEMVYHSMIKEVQDKKIIFCDTDTGLRKYPEIFKKYFGSVVPANDNKFAALNSAVWSGGSFIYVPKNTKLDLPLQSYFRINQERMGQFERTLIIADENSEIHYIEGCTAPIYTKSSLHAAVVEVIVKKNARVRYTTIQNWSSNVLNLVTKRARVEAGGAMEWIDGNMGSQINMKYPSCMLIGDGARGKIISIALANGKNIIQDTGAKMFHLASNTQSQIIAKSLAYDGGISDYRGKVYISGSANNCFSSVDCAAMILDNKSSSKTIPINVCHNKTSTIQHEAILSRLSDEDISYLMSRGLTKDDAIHLIIMGFINDFTNELPMEYAVELNQLLRLDIDEHIG